ncbi:MAG: YfhO family protein [Lachnospiraceae bacterium]|nr:YfhO family protein [Lachnospiraceae bacterium]
MNKVKKVKTMNTDSLDFIKKNVIILAIYIGLAIFFNYGILTKQNLMKWDIMDAYYPLCMSSADLLRNGRLPLWNAAFLFGSPVYIMLGIPFWYPTTLLFELTAGYSLICVAVEYCIHVVIACFGMFLLTKDHLDQDELKNYAIAGIAGAFYGYSGLFISNAEHIMIIVSAAWLPWILYFVRRYLGTKKHIFLMSAALCMGLSILGGYPEIWIATLIILVPYFVIHTKKESRFYKRVLMAGAAYFFFGLETLAVSAISVIPFLLSSRYLERLGTASVLNSYRMPMILSAILPHYSMYAEVMGPTIDISMISMYMGILTLVIFGWVFTLRLKNKIPYLGICLFAFLMMFGEHSFLHSLFYHYFPLFKTLRFPSLWRCVVTVFILLLAAEALELLLEDKRKLGRIAASCGCGGVVFFLAGAALPHLMKDYEYSLVNDFQGDLAADASLLFLYAVVLVMIGSNWKKKQYYLSVLCIMAVLDLFLCQKDLYDATVVRYSQWSGEQTVEMKEAAAAWYMLDRERTHSIDYSDAVRSKSGLNSTAIVINHTLDEEGYLSVQLDYVQKYRGSRHCANSYGVPEVYITDDVVGGSEVDFGQWLQDETVSPYQIYVEDGYPVERKEDAPPAQIRIDYFISGDISVEASMNTEGYLVIQQAYYPGWKVCIDGEEGEIVKINNTFIGVYLTEGTHQVSFLFRPIDFYVGASITAAFLILFIVIAAREAVCFKRNKHRS